MQLMASTVGVPLAAPRVVPAIKDPKNISEGLATTGLQIGLISAGVKFIAAEGGGGGAAAGEMQLFRIITEATPEANLTSNAARGAAARGPEIANPALHQGLSMFDTMQGAVSRVSMLQRGGKTVYGIGEFSIPGGAPGVSVQKTLGPGHYTVTGAPGEIMQFWDVSHIRW
jgi:hypothetical protein